MILTNQEIINTFGALDSLGNKELPIKLTYKVIDNLDKLIKAYQIYEKALEKAKTVEEKQELLQIKKEIDLVTIDKNELIEANITLTPIQLVGLKRIINGWFKCNIKYNINCGLW